MNSPFSGLRYVDIRAINIFRGLIEWSGPLDGEYISRCCVQLKLSKSAVKCFPVTQVSIVPFVVQFI